MSRLPENFQPQEPNQPDGSELLLSTLPLVALAETSNDADTAKTIFIVLLIIAGISAWSMIRTRRRESKLQVHDVSPSLGKRMSQWVNDPLGIDKRRMQRIRKEEQEYNRTKYGTDNHPEMHQ